MDIWFTNSRTRKLFSSQKSLTKKFGDQMGERICKRLTDLSACSNFREAFSIPGHLHPLTGSGDGQFAMYLVHPNRLILEPANEPLPFIDDEKTQLDYDRIDEITINGVVDYHH